MSRVIIPDRIIQNHIKTKINVSHEMIIMRHLDNHDAPRYQQFPLPLLWAKVTISAFPLEEVGGRVEAELEVEGATPEDNVKDEVGCLPPLPLVDNLFGRHGIGYDKLSMSSSYSKSVSPESGTSSDTSSNSSTSCSNHSGASSMIGLSVSTFHGLVVSNIHKYAKFLLHIASKGAYNQNST
jgi:hypothetical protein